MEPRILAVSCLPWSQNSIFISCRFQHWSYSICLTLDFFNHLLDFVFRDENLFARNTSNAQSYTLAYHFLESGVAGVIAFVQLDVNGTQVKSNRIAIGKSWIYSKISNFFSLYFNLGQCCINWLFEDHRYQARSKCQGNGTNSKRPKFRIKDNDSRDAWI